MRKIIPRDWLALFVPTVLVAAIGVTTGYEEGWVVGLLTAGVMMIFPAWLWRRQIRQYPSNT